MIQQITGISRLFLVVKEIDNLQREQKKVKNKALEKLVNEAYFSTLTERAL